LQLLSQNNALVARITELENTRREKVNGDVVGTSADPLSKSDLANPREEITGLKFVINSSLLFCMTKMLSRHIVQELQKEHAAASQKIKLLESENEILKSETKLLQSEAEHLHQVCDHHSRGGNDTESTS